MPNDTLKNRRQRKTSRLAMAIYEVTTESVKVWIGALLPSIAKPKNWRYHIRRLDNGFSDESDRGTPIRTIEHLDFDDWKRPFSKLAKRFYHVETIKDLAPGKDYQIEFEVRVENQWQVLETAFFSTLPESVPDADSSIKPFTVGIGSCFYNEHDSGRAGQTYEALYKSPEHRPDIKFLAGDQVYVDIGLGLFPLDEEDCYERIAGDYAENWKLLRSILRRGGTWLLPDDHEYWNNYPFFDGFNPYLISLEKDEDFQRSWKTAALEAVYNIQQVQTIRTFSVGSDVSFCVADLRTERTRDYFVEPAEFEKIISWVNNLQCPGVLVIPQPLIATEGNKDDANLPDWDQYGELLRAMNAGAHDIVVLTGDVHYGRVSQVMIGSSDNKLVEVITSPISNLSELDGIAAATPETPETFFPMMIVDGMQGNEVEYLATVTTIDDFWDWRFPKERTTEHYMTCEFSKKDGKLQMKIHAWNAREFDRSTGLPQKIAGFDIDPISLN